MDQLYCLLSFIREYKGLNFSLIIFFFVKMQLNLMNFYYIYKKKIVSLRNNEVEREIELVKKS